MVSRQVDCVCVERPASSSADGALHVLLAGDTRSPHTARLAAALRRRRIDVSVLNGPHLVDRVEREYGETLRNLAHEDARLRGNAHFTAVSRIESRWNRYRLRRGIARRRPDVIHVNNLFCGERLDRLARLDRLPAPMVVTAWGSDVDDSAIPKHPSYLLLRQALLSRAELVTTWSEAMIGRCRSYVPARPAQDFRCVHWYADPTRFNTETARAGRESWRRRLGIGAEDVVVLSPRGTAPNYQIDRIVRACVKAFAPAGKPSGAGRAVLVVIVSSGDDEATRSYRAVLRQLAEPLGPNVRFVEQVPHGEVAELFGVADVAVSIPKADGGPASYFELMAMGVPLIVSDLEDYRGVVDPGRNALAVDATADEPVAQAVRSAVADGGLRAWLRAGALASAAEHGTFDDTVDAYIQAYRDAIARRRANRRGSGWLAAG